MFSVASRVFFTMSASRKLSPSRLKPARKFAVSASAKVVAGWDWSPLDLKGEVAGPDWAGFHTLKCCCAGAAAVVARQTLFVVRTAQSAALLTCLSGGVPG